MLCYGMVWYGRVLNAMVWDYATVWKNAIVWHGMVWYSMVWYSMVWYGMAWYGMAWYGMVRYGIWYGMVRHGMVRYGMVWHGMVWYSMVWPPVMAVIRYQVGVTRYLVSLNFSGLGLHHAGRKCKERWNINMNTERSL